MKRINLNGILITGGPLTLHGKFEKLTLVSCTINPGYNNKRYLGIRIEEEEQQQQEQEKEEEDDHTAPATNANNTYITPKKSDTSLKEISLIKSISGGIEVDHSVSTITVEDSIVDNLGGPGPAIQVNENNKRENTNLKLEARRSDILSRYQDPNVLMLRDICCSNSILTNRVKVVMVNQMKQDQSNNNSNDTNSCTSLRNSRYEQESNEQESIFENLGKKGNDAIVDCTVETPIFISTNFGHPAYLHLDHLTSKSILEGAENTLEMGVFNRNDKALGMRNLNLRLREFLPLGIRGGVVYIY